MSQCSNCGAGIRPGAQKCVKCGSIVDQPAPTQSGGGSAQPGPQAPQVVYVQAPALRKIPLLAAILSLCIPGIGQLYNGQILKAVVLLVVWGVFFASVENDGAKGALGFIIHIVAAIDAWVSAAKLNKVTS